MLLVAGLLAGWSQVRAGAAEPLTERQRVILANLAKDRYGGRWTELTTNQLADLHQRADAYLRDLRRYHLPGGLVASVEFSDTNRTSVVAYHALEDSAAWTSFAIAAHAFRFSVTRDPRSFEDIRASLTGLELLLKVSGRPGYLARFAGPANDPAYARFYATWGGPDPTRAGFGKLAFPGTGTNAHLVWLGGPSREHLAALNFGLMAAYQLAQRDVEIRNRVAAAIQLVVERLREDHNRLDDGQGNLTFLTPLLETALFRSAATVNSTKFRVEFEAKAKEFLTGGFTVPLQRYANYTPNVFNFASLITLSRQEQSESSRRLLFQERLNQLMREAEPHLNPFFAGCYAGAFERLPNMAALTVTLQGMLYDFPAPPRWATPVDLTQATEIPIVEANHQRWSKLALPTGARPPAPFQWAASPFALKGGAGSLVAHPGVDFLLPFWMGRDATLISSEDVPQTAQAASGRTTRPASRPGTTNAPARPGKP